MTEEKEDTACGQIFQQTSKIMELYCNCFSNAQVPISIGKTVTI